MHPTLQVRTDLLLGPHGLLKAVLRAYTSRHSRDAFAFHATGISANALLRRFNQDADSETQESHNSEHLFMQPTAKPKPAPEAPS